MLISPSRQFALYFSSMMRSHGHLYTALVARRRALEVGEEVGDVIPRMSVQTSPQPLLVEVMGDQSDGPSENEQTVQNTVLQSTLAYHPNF